MFINHVTDRMQANASPKSYNLQLPTHALDLPAKRGWILQNDAEADIRVLGLYRCVDERSAMSTIVGRGLCVSARPNLVADA